MEFEITKIDDVVVVDIMIDTLDASNAKAFKSDISPLINENKKILLNMSHVRFVDSSGCGALLSCLSRLHSNDGSLKLMGVRKAVRTLFALVRMHRIVEIFDKQEDALEAFKE